MVDHHTVFQANVQCLQCAALKDNGQRCRRRTCIGSPLCFQHLESIKHLKVKQTPEYHGVGLFAYDRSKPDNAIVFRPDEIIVAYGGEVLTGEQINQRYDYDGEEHTAPYGLQRRRPRNSFEDGALLRSAGTLANHANRRQSNCDFVQFQGAMALKATKRIRNGQQILVDYGRAYQMGEPGVEFSTKYVRN